MFLNKSEICTTPKYLSSSYRFKFDSQNNAHKHTISSISNKENSNLQENLNITENPDNLLENLFKKLNYFSNSSKNFMKSADKLSKHVVKVPLAERNMKDYEQEKRKMENSLNLIVNFKFSQFFSIEYNKNTNFFFRKNLRKS